MQQGRGEALVVSPDTEGGQGGSTRIATASYTYAFPEVLAGINCGEGCTRVRSRRPLTSEGITALCRLNATHTGVGGRV